MLYVYFCVKYALRMLENCLKELRLKKEITQISLAESVGVSRQTIHAIETSKYVPSVELALKIAKLLRLAVEDIFKLKKI